MNSTTHTRTPRSTLVKWLLDHPGVWASYPVPGIHHAYRIFSSMQCAGLFSPRSQCNSKTISSLIASARIAQQFNAASDVEDAPLTPPHNETIVKLQ